VKDHKSDRQPKRQKRRKPGFFSSLLLFASGFTAGLGTAAFLAYQINQVPLPFIAPPTRDDDSARKFLEPETPEEEGLQFHQILRDRTPPQIAEEEDEPEPEAAEAPRPTPSPGAFFIQVGAFSDREAAESMIGELALLNVRASVRQAAGGSDTPFRVLVGPYPTSGEAEEMQAQLAFSGYNSNLVSARSQ